ncbi:MAG: biopolymer transporter ExbD [bacterium]|nr:biopolymer transporter ExbD [Candidatus Limimorpha caballi]
MALKRRNQRRVEFNSSSMSDLVFLLLIFFMLTSTLVAPNAIKLLLPQSSSRTMAKQTVTVYIDNGNGYHIGMKRGNAKAVDADALEEELAAALDGTEEGTVVVRSDKTVEVQYVVNVIDAVNNINNATHQSHKVLLATSSKK